MAAITAAEQGVRQVLVLEGTPEPLQKVRISGGGRCNVTHACWDPRELVTHYPRGSRPLRGPFSRFACGDAIVWFDEHGLTLVEEPDGRMFPQQNRSEAVIQCLQRAAWALGVQLRTKAMVQQVRVHPEGGFVLEGRGLEHKPPLGVNAHLLDHGLRAQLDTRRPYRLLQALNHGLRTVLLREHPSIGFLHQR